MSDRWRGPLEARLLEVERRCVRMGSDLRALRRDAVALGQGLWDDAAQASGGAVGRVAGGPPPPGNTAFAGRIWGCASLGAQAAVTITSGGSTLWTGHTASDGSYSGTLNLASNQTLPLVITPDSPRFQDLTTTTGLLIAGTSNTIPTRTLAPASSNHCTSNCPDPVAATLLCTPSKVYSPFNLVWRAGTPAIWTGAPSGSPTSTFQFTGGALQINGVSGLWTLQSADCAAETWVFSGNDGSAWAGYTMTITEP